MKLSKLFRRKADPLAAGTVDVITEVRSQAALLKAGALQSAIFNSANFSSIATDAKGVIQIFNVGAERMRGYAAAEVMNKITPEDISDPQEVIVRAKALSVELAATNTPGFEALVFKAEGPLLGSNQTNPHPQKRCAHACRRTLQQALP